MEIPLQDDPAIQDPAIQEPLRDERDLLPHPAPLTPPMSASPEPIPEPQEPETKLQEPETEPQEPETKLQEPETKPQEPEMLPQEPEVKPQEPVRTQSTLRPRDPAVQSSRGNCKACTLPITGKSISSADGRLTGRYHKACFVCSTCKEAFSSATFYVHEDRPYCERHYHELNGSLCASCDNGIEGQYLEDEAAKKHHIGCFRCGDCGMVLSNGYFEVNGRSFCERDAWRRVQQPWHGNQNGQNRPHPLRKTSGSSPLGPNSPLGPPGAPRANFGGGFGLPAGNRLGPPGPRPKMEKRMTRLGMM